VTIEAARSRLSGKYWEFYADPAPPFGSLEAISAPAEPFRRIREDSVIEVVTLPEVAE
jgi:hypothetical protein